MTLIFVLLLAGTLNAQSIEKLYLSGEHVARGNQYMQMNLWDEAETEFWHAVEYDYLNIDARKGLGDVYRNKGMYERAIENYQIVVEQQPNNVDIQYQIALSYYDDFHFDKAIIAARKALEISPDLAKAENLSRLSEERMRQQGLVNEELKVKERQALQTYYQQQQKKEGSFVSALIPGWRMIQTGQGKTMWTGYTVLASTAALMIGGSRLRSAGAKAYTQAEETADIDVYQNRVDLGEKRYKYGGYMINIGLSIFALNMIDSFFFKGAIFGGGGKVDPSLPDREREYHP